MKRTTPVAIACSLLILCAACSPAEQPVSSSLTMYLPSAAWLRADYPLYFRTLFDGNPNKTPGLSLEIKTFDSSMSFEKSLTTEVLAGEGPDIFFIVPDDMNFATSTFLSRGAFLNLTPYIEADTEPWLETLQPAVMASGQWDGQTYLLPMFYTTSSLWITTQEVLDAYGLTIGDVVTYEQLAQCLAPISDAIANGEVAVFSDEALTPLLYDFVDYEGQTCSFTDPGFVRVVDTMLALEDHSDILTNAGGLWWRQRLLRDGKVLFIKMWDKYNTVEIAFNTMSESFHQTPRLIQIIGDDALAEVTFYVAINANSTQPEEAYKFMKYLFSEKVQHGRTGPYAFTMYPVHHVTFDAMLELYRKDGATVGMKIPSLEGTVRKLPEEDFDLYADAMRSISHAYIKDGKFIDEIFSPLWEDLLSGKLDKDLFIQRLQSRTMLFLAE